MILALTSTDLASGQAPSGQPIFSARATEVEVYATVTGPDNRPVKGLGKADFVLVEDGERQEITTFGADEVPAAVALAIDRSFSMRGAPLTTARTAGRAFIGALRPDDRAMLISISGEVEVLAPLTTEKTTVARALDTLDPWGTTSLHDALIRSLELLDGEIGRRAIIVLSDGEDRYSKAQASDVADRARRSDVLIYPIALGRARPPLFAELAALSGGRSFHLRDPQELQPTLTAIAEDLRAQYLLGYAPRRPWSDDDAEWRSISVDVQRSGMRVRARSGYSTK